MNFMTNLAPLALLVEDNTDLAELYAAFLEHVGFRVATAGNAAAGFITASTEQPHVIVVDVRLPGGPDGLTLAMKLRLDRRTRHIPIVVLTGDTEHRARANAARCDAFLTKPCLPTVLAHHLRTLAGGSTPPASSVQLSRSG